MTAKSPPTTIAGDALLQRARDVCADYYGGTISEKWYRRGDFDEGDHVQIALAALSANISAERARMEAVTKALALYDEGKKVCPFDTAPYPPSDKPCTRCRADATEGCRLTHGLAYGFVEAVRTALSPPESPAS